AITGSFYVKFMRYMLPLYPFLTLMAASVLIALLRFSRERTDRNVVAPLAGARLSRLMGSVLTILPYAAITIVLAGTMFQGLALLNVYSQPNTRIQASLWIYSHVKPGSVLTYEQWDDPLPVLVGNHNPYIYSQATHPDANGQLQTGLVLYGDD